MIVTLAGHVDHGKTTLVRLLTGTDTDRLAEERRRGLTIDLGFAYLENDDQVLGFVDVPGHHRFIHNMVAGVAAHQFALLAIAADDGPMPQSREHLQILSLIGVRRGLVALTKCDRVDADRIAAARREVDALVAGTFLEGCPVIATAATGTGLDELRGALFEAAQATDPGAPDRPFRMAIDRAFTLKGAGVVVTGTVHAGSVAVDQDVCHFPSGRRARVRGLRVQNRPAQSARPGDRAALNLSGLEADELGRGDWLALAPDPGHRHLVIELEVLDDFPRALRPWLPVHVYHATRHTTARLARLERTPPAAVPGATAGATLGYVLAELDCAEPLLARHGDRLVIRDQGLDRTLGGGRVIDNRVRPRRRHAPARLASIAALQQPTPAASLATLLELGAVDLPDFQRIWDLDDSALDALCASLPATRHGRNLILDATWSKWSRALLSECESRHAADAALQGLQENAFLTPVPAEFRGELLRGLAAAGLLAQRAGRYQPARHETRLSPQETALQAKLQPLLAVPQPMSLGDIGKTLKMPLPVLQKAVRPLVAKGVLVQINDKRVYLPQAVRALADAAVALGAQGPFTAAQFRDAAGIGRNIAIDVLEYFDAKRFTRRQGEVRTVVGDPAQLFGS
jgi:selenocysteine-specific elongation factor